jgi:hypothetical protein
LWRGDYDWALLVEIASIVAVERIEPAHDKPSNHKTLT